MQAFNSDKLVGDGESAMTGAGREAGLEGEFCEPGWSSAMSVGQPRLWKHRLLRGPYLGDVSALCFLPSTPNSYLIAGTGPQVLLYDLVSGDLLLSQQVFDGVRVHGIHVCREFKSPVTVAVHGEGRVKVLELQSDGRKDFKLRIVQSLPRFFQWILDVRFLQEYSSLPGEKQQALLAVGLSDNSVSIWNLRNCSPVLRVECSERCLLYSLRLWGSSVETLRVAAGTIFNKVLIWDVRCWNKEDKDLNGFDQSQRINYVGNNSVPLTWTVEPLQELLGHEGSIHRISWSEDGLCVASASDDRSARIWARQSTDTLLFTAGPVLYGHGARLWDCYVADNLLITASEDCTSRIWTRQGHHLATLTGHLGRGIWRCVYDHESATLVTSGADSAIKVQLLTRWSHEAEFGVPGATSSLMPLAQSSSSNTEIFCISLVGPNVLGEGSSTSMDSNSEYVRCLDLAGPGTLYIATNQGHVYHVALLDSKKQEWTEITHEEISGPIVCMNLLVDGAIVTGDDSDDDKQDELVAFGNGSGIATALGIRIAGKKPTVIWQCKWLADEERQLLGVFWCKSLGRRFVFSTDPRGLVRVWLLKRCLEAQTPVQGQDFRAQALLVAICQSPLHARVVCLDVCPVSEGNLGHEGFHRSRLDALPDILHEGYFDVRWTSHETMSLLGHQLLVCGDQRGNLASFKFPSALLSRHGEESSGSPSQLQSIGVFKGAHGISAVASVSVTSPSNKQDVIVTSTGRDGCICKFVVDTITIKDQGQPSGQGFACTGVEDVAAITVVESVEYRLDKRKCKRRLAAGFIASNFILWDLTQQSELMRVMCGGWRRPHSFVVGDIPEHQCCFAFLKDHVVYVHRNWTYLPILLNSVDVENEKNSAPTTSLLSQLPQSLHGQFHGREIHSVHFVSAGINPVTSSQHVTKWIATGAEDGAVRISRYDTGGLSNLESCLLLGEHTGGSAVRALTLVQGAHSFVQYQPPSIRTLDVCKTDPLLLLSVGAKEVLTCWLLEWKQDFSSASVDETALISTVPEYTVNESPVTEALSSKWLCSYAPRSFKLARKKEKASKTNDKHHLKAFDKTVDMHLKEKQLTEESRIITSDDDDLRFLAVTAMSIYCPDTGSVFCFVITASSNATLRLIAMDLNTRIWVEVAVLEHHTVPVLTLQHLVIPIGGSWQNAFLIVSGATDGSIAVWDLTNLVITFMKDLSSGVARPTSSAGTQLRPRTGRGSQGGRRFRSAKQRQAGLSKERKKVDNNATVVEEAVNIVSPIKDENVKEHVDIDAGADANIKASIGTAVQVKGVPEATEIVPYQSSVLLPLFTFATAHQSGVNCLSAAIVSDRGDSEVVVVSGGDDQRIHVLKFKIHPYEGEEHRKCEAAIETSGDGVNGIVAPSTEESQARGDSATSQVQLLINSVREGSVEGAHSSALKGIWTDGAWVFSTGLDQRLRYWHLGDIVNLCESSASSCAMEDPSDKRLLSLPLVEFGHCVIDVPEAEDLHVESGPMGGQYCIAVVGRGLQVFTFTGNR